MWILRSWSDISVSSITRRPPCVSSECKMWTSSISLWDNGWIFPNAGRPNSAAKTRKSNWVRVCSENWCGWRCICAIFYDTALRGLPPRLQNIGYAPDTRVQGANCWWRFTCRLPQCNKRQFCQDRRRCWPLTKWCWQASILLHKSYFATIGTM